MIDLLDFAKRRLPMVTPLAAVAVCRAVEDVCGLRCGVKWPNDLILGGRKVCGILTESAFRPDGQPAPTVSIFDRVSFDR